MTDTPTKTGAESPAAPSPAPTVEDVQRRLVELLYTPAGDGLATIGDIRRRLIAEFGILLFDEAANARLTGTRTSKE